MFDIGLYMFDIGLYMFDIGLSEIKCLQGNTGAFPQNYTKF